MSESGSEESEMAYGMDDGDEDGTSRPKRSWELARDGIETVSNEASSN